MRLRVILATGLICAALPTIFAENRYTPGATDEAATLPADYETATFLIHDAPEMPSEFASLAVTRHSPSARSTAHWTNRMTNHHQVFALESRNMLHKRANRKESERRRKKAEPWYRTESMNSPVELYMSVATRQPDGTLRMDEIMIDAEGNGRRTIAEGPHAVTDRALQVDAPALRELVEWAAESGFFDFDRVYGPDGTGGKKTAETLKLEIALGSKRHTVVVPYWSGDDTRQRSGYPDELKNIVQAIYEFASL